MTAIKQVKTPTSIVQLELNIEGIHCGGCSSRLTSALEQRTGIREATIDHKTGRGRIDYNPNRVKEKQIRATIDRLGFSVGSE